MYLHREEATALTGLIKITSGTFSSYTFPRGPEEKLIHLWVGEGGEGWGRFFPFLSIRAAIVSHSTDGSVSYLSGVRVKKRVRTKH